MNRYLMIVMMALLPVWAQEAGKLPNVKLVQLKNVGTGAAQELLQPFMDPSSPVRINVSGRTNMITLSGPPDAIAVVEEFIRKFDVASPPVAPKPVRNVEVTAYMLLGTNEAESADQAPSSELAGVVKQLRGMFPFKNYKLFETMVVRGREGYGGEANGVASDTSRALYQFKYNTASVSTDDKGRIIKLDTVRFGGKVPFASTVGPGALQYADTGVNTNVDLREGQKVVIGKASVGQAQTSLFLVVSAKVVD